MLLLYYSITFPDVTDFFRDIISVLYWDIKAGMWRQILMPSVNANSELSTCDKITQNPSLISCCTQPKHFSTANSAWGEVGGVQPVACSSPSNSSVWLRLTVSSLLAIFKTVRLLEMTAVLFCRHISDECYGHLDQRQLCCASWDNVSHPVFHQVKALNVIQQQ